MRLGYGLRSYGIGSAGDESAPARFPELSGTKLMDLRAEPDSLRQNPDGSEESKPGDPVGYWESFLGDGGSPLTQNTGRKKPTAREGAVYFDGGDDSLLRPRFTSVQVMTGFVQCSVATGQTIISQAGPTQGDPGVTDFSLYSSDTSVVELMVSDGEANLAQNGTLEDATTDDGTMHSFTFRWDAGQGQGNIWLGRTGQELGMQAGTVSKNRPFTIPARGGYLNQGSYKYVLLVAGYLPIEEIQALWDYYGVS